MVSVFALVVLLTTVDWPPAKLVVDNFEGFANWLTISEKLPFDAPWLAVMVATFSSEDVPVKPLKLLSVPMLVSAPRKASRAAWILPIDDSWVVAFAIGC